MERATPQTLAEWNAAGEGYLPGYLGMEFNKVTADEVVGVMTIRPQLRVWNGFLHGGSVVALADTCCGYGTVAAMPEGAGGFTTLELKTNFLSTLREGTIKCTARPLHQGRTTHVWDAHVEPQGGGKALAHFRCTQMILWPRA
jgi:uncharacterized protein (TIGR00369 family)